MAGYVVKQFTCPKAVNHPTVLTRLSVEQLHYHNTKLPHGDGDGDVDDDLIDDLHAVVLFVVTAQPQCQKTCALAVPKVFCVKHLWGPSFFFVVTMDNRPL